MYESEACSGDEEAVKAGAAAAETPPSTRRLRSRRRRGPKRRRVDVSSDDLSTPSMDLFPPLGNSGCQSPAINNW